VTVENPFKGLKDKRIDLGEKLNINGQRLSIIPEVEDAELFMSIRGEKPEEEGKRMTKIMIGMLKRSYPTAEDEDLRKFIAGNYASLMEEIAIIYGFSSREKIEQIKKKAIEKTES
jgi:hypothetical protein